jgi:hypothetical protein
MYRPEDRCVAAGGQQKSRAAPDFNPHYGFMVCLFRCSQLALRLDPLVNRHAHCPCSYHARAATGGHMISAHGAEMTARCAPGLCRKKHITSKLTRHAHTHTRTLSQVANGVITSLLVLLLSYRTLLMVLKRPTLPPSLSQVFPLLCMCIQVWERERESVCVCVRERDAEAQGSGGDGCCLSLSLPPRAHSPLARCAGRHPEASAW